MAHRGKHTVEAVNARKRSTYEPSFDVPHSNPDQKSPHVALVVALILLVALIPLSLGRIAADIDAQAYANAERSAFPLLADSGVEQPAASFGLFSDLPAGSTAAADFDERSVPAAPQRYTERVGVELQGSLMEGGCELVSLDIVLDAMGLDADLHDIAENHLNVDGHFATGYTGDPYGMGGGYPEGIVAAANGYLASRGVPYRAHNITGSSFDQLASLTDKGYPILVWMTMGYDEPDFSGVFDNGLEWYSNEHCIVMYGVSDDKVQISDPLEGLTTCDASEFKRIYELCGSMAVAIF